MVAKTISLDDVVLKVYTDDLSNLPVISNVDVEVVERDGSRWSATFFTIEGIETLFAKNAVTGECAGGTYFWTSDMVIVRSLSLETLERTVQDLRATGEFRYAFRLLREE